MKVETLDAQSLVCCVRYLIGILCKIVACAEICHVLDAASSVTFTTHIVVLGNEM